MASAQPWTVKPESCVNLGITFAGLGALGVSAPSRASFPAEYAEGAVARAALVGDVGDSGPGRWLGWLADPGLHLVLVVFAQSAAALESATGRLQRAWAAGWRELGRHDGERLPGDVAHFGYRDGLSQPTVDGVPLSGLPDHLPRAPVGEFLLGYPSQFSGHSYPVPTPCALGVNGSFAALRVLEQDVDGFAEFLTRQAARTGMSEELVAAKLCGRWRNGTPLVLSPDTDTPEPPIPAGGLNDFDYVGEFGDDRGYRCPVGSHVRRMYPRGSRVAGNGGHRHRIVRRGIPYGPPYDPAQPARRAGARAARVVHRGQPGRPVRVSDDRNGSTTAPSPPGSAAPGTRWPVRTSPEAGTFSIPRPGGPIVLDGPVAVRDHPGRRLLFPAQHHRPALPGGPATGPEARARIALMTGSRAPGARTTVRPGVPVRAR